MGSQWHIVVDDGASVDDLLCVPLLSGRGWWCVCVVCICSCSGGLFVRCCPLQRVMYQLLLLLK
jgi:hypothetical protein